MVQKPVLDIEDFSKWRLQDCHDAGQRLLVFDPHQQNPRALLHAIQKFWTLNPNTDISWHFSTEECRRPKYGSNRDDLTENQMLQYDQFGRSNAMDMNATSISRPWSRRLLSDLTEALWAPQQVGRLNIMLHFDPPSPKSISAVASRERLYKKSHVEIEFAGFEDDEILPYSATALQRLSKIRADKAKLNVKAVSKETSASMEDIAMTDAETSASEGQSKAIHDGIEMEPPTQAPSLSITNTSLPIVPQKSRKRIKTAGTESQIGMQGRNDSARPRYNVGAAPRSMEMNKMPSLQHFQNGPQSMSSPSQQRFDNSIGTVGTTTNAQFGQGPMHFSNWMGPPANTFGHHINVPDARTPDARNLTPSMSAPMPSNRRGGIADAIRRRSKASLGFGARAMQSPRSTQNNSEGFGGATDRNKPYDFSTHVTDTDMTDNHLDLDERTRSSSQHVNAILRTRSGTILKEVSDADYERVIEDSEPEL